MKCPYCHGAIKIIADESIEEKNTPPIQVIYGIHVLFASSYDRKVQRPKIKGFWSDAGNWYIGELIRGTCLRNALRRAKARNSQINEKYGGNWELDESVHEFDDPDGEIYVNWSNLSYTRHTNG